MDFGNLFSALGRALPGFVEGRQQAIKDNWQDLKKYNTTEKGQLENMWTEATWKPALNNAYINSWTKGLGFVSETVPNASLNYRDYWRKLNQQDFLYQNQDLINNKTLENLLRPGVGQQQQQLPGAMPATLPTMEGDNSGIEGMQRTK